MAVFVCKNSHRAESLKGTIHHDFWKCLAEEVVDPSLLYLSALHPTRDLRGGRQMRRDIERFNHIANPNRLQM